MFLRQLLPNWFVSFVLVLALISPAHAAQMCEYVFTDPVVRSRGVDFGLRSEHGNKAPTPNELLQFKKTQADLWSTLNKLPEKRRSEIEHLLSAVEFFDYRHTAKKLIDNFIDNRRGVMDFSTIYDTVEARAVPYKSFLNARDNFLRKERPPVTAELILEIHKRVMENGVENVRFDQLGKWRDGHWFGRALDSLALTPKEAEVIKSNPYLNFREVGRGEKGTGSVWEKIKIWGSKKDMVVEPGDGAFVAGFIDYPYVRTLKQETIDLIKDSHPDLHRRLVEFRKQNPPHENGLSPKELEVEFTKALVEERMARFNKERAELGEIRIGENEHRYIDIVADLQRDLVAIHPTLNGNGRTTRLFMNYLLTSEGLPPVRLVDPFLDVQVSQKEWREYVHKGVVNNAQLQADILFRIKNGLTVEYSPELLYPGLPELVKISLKKQGSDKEVRDYAQAKVNSEQFSAFLKTMLKENPELRQAVETDRLRTMSKMADLFVEYYRSKTVRYIHDKDGEREISIRLVDTDFVDLFGVNRSYSKEHWDNKINRWYDRDMLAWRGLADKQREHTTQDLLNYFKAPTPHLVSNSVLRQLRSGKNIVQAIKEDFDTYNREAINGNLIEMANDHHKTGPRYGTSYGYSTSKREVVGKAFAMGAMVVGEYGKHQDPALQAQLKSRINVASFRAHKDVDLGRLKAFDPEFSYIYGRQAEVMGIGGTDPDAVILIQRLNAQGNVIETFLRNMEKPSEVFLIEGRYVPGEGPLPVNKIKATYDLGVQNPATPEVHAPNREARSGINGLLERLLNR